MKKLLSVLFIMIIALTLTSCREFIPPQEDKYQESKTSNYESSVYEESSLQSSVSNDAEQSRTSSSVPDLDAEEYLQNEHYTIIANRSTKKYHLKGCRYVSQIKQDNIIGFENADRAMNDGYSPCRYCFK